MCPDRDLISAYVDGEVPSPWRERLEEHISGCAGCRSAAEAYARLGEELRRDRADETAALEGGRARLEGLLGGLPAAEASPAFGGRAWLRPVSLPLPLAAAAALAVLFLGGAAAFLAFRPAQSGPAAAAAADLAPLRAVASGEIAPMQARPASMEELLRYLDSSNGQVTLTIKLPTGTTFGSAGKPVIMRSGKALRGSPVGRPSP